MKYPEKGLVKTRLAEYLGDDFTVRLYSNFLVDLLETCQDVNAETIIAYTASDKMNGKKLFWEGQFPYIKQKGDNLGDRMYNALKEVAAKGYNKCILIGNDCHSASIQFVYSTDTILMSNWRSLPAKG